MADLQIINSVNTNNEATTRSLRKAVVSKSPGTVLKHLKHARHDLDSSIFYLEKLKSLDNEVLDSTINIAGTEPTSLLSAEGRCLWPECSCTEVFDDYESFSTIHLSVEHTSDEDTFQQQYRQVGELALSFINERAILRHMQTFLYGNKPAATNPVTTNAKPIAKVKLDTAKRKSTIKSAAKKKALVVFPEGEEREVWRTKAEKPNIPYWVMIKQAILESNYQEASKKDICCWIEHTFLHFKMLESESWKKTVGKTLEKLFVKVDETVTPCLWGIDELMLPTTTEEDRPSTQFNLAQVGISMVGSNSMMLDPSKPMSMLANTLSSSSSGNNKRKKTGDRDNDETGNDNQEEDKENDELKSFQPKRRYLGR